MLTTIWKVLSLVCIVNQIIALGNLIYQRAKSGDGKLGPSIFYGAFLAITASYISVH